MGEPRVGFFWPLGRWVFVLAGVAVFAVALLGTRDMLSWPYHEWAQTSALFHQRLDLAGPLAAFFGAYLSGRLTPPSRLFALPKFQRDPYQFLRQSLFPISLTMMTGYVLALVPVLVMTARTATYGSPDLLVIFSGLLALVAYVVLGWLLGLLARSAFIAPVAFALAFAVTIAGYSGDTFAAVAPVLHISPTLGFHESAPFVLFRIAFFFVVVVTVLVAAAGILEHRQFRRGRPSPLRAALWVIPVAFVGIGLSSTPALFASDGTLPRSCSDVTGVEVCVHVGHQAQLMPLVEVIGPIVHAVGAENLPFDRVYDRSLETPTVQPDNAAIFYYDLSPTLAIDSAASEITRIAAGAYGCFNKYGINTSNEFVNNMYMLDARLQQDRGRYPDNPFTALSDSQLRTWISAHRDRVASCGIGSGELP